MTINSQSKVIKVSKEGRKNYESYDAFVTSPWPAGCVTSFGHRTDHGSFKTGHGKKLNFLKTGHKSLKTENHKETSR